MFAARTPTLPPATHTNCYALGDRDVLIVEPAPSDAGEQSVFVDWVRAIQAEGRRVLAVLVTHHHRDHAGGAAALSQSLDLPLWAHPLTASRLHDARVDRMLHDGELIELAGTIPQRWQVLHTPGHAPGHVCLWEERTRTVVLGDMISGQSTILIPPGDGDMRQYLEQLSRLAALGPKLGLPSHGEPMAAPVAVLRATHTHRLMREAKVVRALESAGGSCTINDLMVEAYDDAPLSAWPLARLSLEAHLEKLVTEKRVRRGDGHVFTLVEPAVALGG